jgi:hypothetical protein
MRTRKTKEEKIEGLIQSFSFLFVHHRLINVLHFEFFTTLFSKRGRKQKVSKERKKRNEQ